MPKKKLLRRWLEVPNDQDGGTFGSIPVAVDCAGSGGESVSEGESESESAWE